MQFKDDNLLEVLHAEGFVFFRRFGNAAWPWSPRTARGQRANQRFKYSKSESVSSSAVSPDSRTLFGIEVAYEKDNRTSELMVADSDRQARRRLNERKG